MLAEAQYRKRYPASEVIIPDTTPSHGISTVTADLRPERSEVSQAIGELADMIDRAHAAFGILLAALSPYLRQEPPAPATANEVARPASCDAHGRINSIIAEADGLRAAIEDVHRRFQG